MSFGAIWAEATHWDFQVLGHGIRRGRQSRAGGSDSPVLYDVHDKKCEEPLSVLDVVVRRVVDRQGPRIWRLTSFGLPQGCESPLCLPASLDVFKEIRVPACAVIDGKTSSLRDAPSALRERLEHLRPSAPATPDSRFTISWREPLIRAELASDQSDSISLEQHATNDKYIQSIIMGPKLSATLSRTSTGKLELLELHGGPDGIDEIASELFRIALAEIETAKAAIAAEAASRAPRDVAKPVYVFGQLWRPPEKKTGRTKITWDAESESFALWSALQQWERSVRRQPWRWQLHRVEIHKGAQQSAAAPVSLPEQGSKGRNKALQRSASTKFRPVAEGGTRPKTRGATRDPTKSKQNELLALMRGFDRDRSGSIDWKEFRDCSRGLVDLIGGEEANWTEEVARREFEELDSNGNGVIEEEEWLMFVGSVLSVLGDSGMQRVLTLLGQDMSAFTTRTLSIVNGDVDIGMACKKGHPIRPLRLKPWGDNLAKQLGLDGGFLCAAVDDPPVYNASCRQRCTHCNALNAHATFAVTCKPCGDAFPAGWWCTSCIIEASVPRDRHGRRVPLRSVMDLKSTCRFCSQPAITIWPLNEDSYQLCHDHAADRLLEEAARGTAASGRELEEGKALILVISIKLKVPLEQDEDDLERFAELVEAELLEALSLEGAPLDVSQLEVSKVIAADSPDECIVHATVTRAFGRPSPYELFIRLRSLGVDLDGPLYDSKDFSTLSRMSGVVEIVDVIVADEDEEFDMTVRMTEVVAGQWPRASSKMTLVVRPQRSLLPRAAVLSLRCAKGPEGVGGGVFAFALAFPAGSRRDVPSLQEFEAFTRSRRGSTFGAPKAKAVAKGVVRKHAKARSARGGMTSRDVPAEEAESGCVVSLVPSPGGGHEMLIGEATLLGLTPDSAYDVFVAIFPNDAARDDLEPLAWVSHLLHTCSEDNSTLFDADCDSSVLFMTEEPNAKRRSCFLEMLGLRDAPCIIDQNSCSISSKLTGRSGVHSEEMIQEHHISVGLEDAEAASDSPAIVGGLQLPSPVLSAKPCHTQAEVELEVIISADVVDLPCARHRFSGILELPLVLSLDGSVTDARCCKPTSENSRCANCRWTQVQQKHRIRIKIAIDIIRMAQIQDWHSVRKRAEVCRAEDVKSAVAVMINARPQPETDLIMQVFELATGRSAEVDFPVRPDGATALHASVEESNMDVARALLNRKADPSVVNTSLESPLHSAVRGGSGLAPQMVDMLIGEARAIWKGEHRHERDVKTAKQQLLDLQDINGHTVLHLACSAGHMPLVKCLLRARADPQISDGVGWNALHMAAAAGTTACAAALISDHRLDPNAMTGDVRKVTPLHLACERCNIDVAVELIQRNADPRIMSKGNKHVLASLSEGISQWTSFVGVSGVVELVQRILLQSLPPKSALEEAGATLCNWALHSSDNTEAVAVAQRLLDCFRANAYDEEPALGRALLDVIASAVGSGARGRVGDRYEKHRVAYSQTPTASAMHLAGSVQLALELGADANASDAEADTALHHLLRCVANWRLLPNDGVTGQVVASSVHLLLNNRASVNLSNSKGENPLSLVQRMDDMGEKFAQSWQEVFGIGRGGNFLPAIVPTRPTSSGGANSPKAPSGRPQSRGSRGSRGRRRSASKSSRQRRPSNDSGVKLPNLTTPRR